MTIFDGDVLAVDVLQVAQALAEIAGDLVGAGAVAGVEPADPRHLRRGLRARDRRDGQKQDRDGTRQPIPSERHGTSLTTYAFRTRTARPAAIRPIPPIRATSTPAGPVFSTSTNRASTATATRFITPTTNRMIISAQQQPRHHVPWRIPICSAPIGPSRQCVIRNASGRRQRTRHAPLIGNS